MSTDGSGVSVTIVHDGQFCVAWVERWEPEGRSIARHVFGAEPALPEILGFVSGRAYQSLCFLELADDRKPVALAGNPKRRQREAARAAREPAQSTRSQAALQAALVERKQERRTDGRRRRAEEADERYRRRVEQRKEKKRGR